MPVEQDTEETVVVFRVFKPRPAFDEKGGDVIALFPYDLGTDSPFTCSSYMHMGQHGSADPLTVVRELTRPAKPEEYADLAKELESRGYRLKIRKRIGRDAYVERCAQLRRINDRAYMTLAERCVDENS